VSEDTRLRRLDALFAERVLGARVVKASAMGELPPWCDPCCTQYATVDGKSFTPFTSWPPYTRSLDAAWEGFVRLRAIADDPYRGLSFHECPKGDSCQGWFAGIFSGDDGDDIIGPLGTACDGHANHPAEALVLACLRAVGVEESELQ